MTLATPGSAAAAADVSPAVLTPWRAHLELLLIYAVMFGARAVLSIAAFLTSPPPTPRHPPAVIIPPSPPGIRRGIGVGARGGGAPRGGGRSGARGAGAGPGGARRARRAAAPAGPRHRPVHLPEPRSDRSSTRAARSGPVEPGDRRRG